MGLIPAPKKVVVLGNSCAGKTTFSARLAPSLQLPHVELDALFWEPNWTEAQTEIFRARVAEALKTDGWVVDGNYKNKIKDLVWPEADTFIWLDPSLLTVLLRFFSRSLRQSLTREMLWGGCQESLRNSIFNRNSLLVWILTTHNKKADDYLALLANPPAGTRAYRLRTVSEIDAFLASGPC